MPSLEQDRAAFAWECVQNCTPEYVNLAKSAPALIMSNGLMQTLAFFEDKGGERKNPKKPHFHDLNSHIFRWLGKRFERQHNFPSKDNDKFRSVIAALQQADSLLYRRVTEETMELLRWIRQFAAAVNKGV